MSEASANFDSRLYFGALTVLLVEANELEAEILTQVLSSFKVRSTARMRSSAQAQTFLDRDAAQLIVVGGLQSAEEPDEYDLIRWVRRSTSEALQTTAVILLTGHTLQTNVLRARDCGANFVIAKPITPKVMYDRVAWLAKDPRPFIGHANYTGPDRRFQKLGPPPGTDGRRHDDLSLAVGEAKAPNLSQSEIDAMLSGKGTTRL